ncbi:MAG: response regulator transcription factor, partial [Planctomycetales bacterium]|nr:response regulator transcription factor [Planctomycetales bacterium]
YEGAVVSIKLLVADDHEVVRSGIGTLLGDSEVEIVGLAGTVDETVSLTKSVQPDVVLLDVRLGTEDGLSALEQIRSETPQVSVVMMSTYDNPTYVARAIALGATDYILKDSSRVDVLEAIQRAATKELPSETSILRRVKSTMEKRKDRSDSKDVPLTNRELQVLRHIALGLSNREIGTSLSISVETVKEHVQNILRKLDSTDRTAAAVWAVKSGLIGP